jgi:uncharacterized protein involved in type VI secretion and phage assembly
MVFYDEHGQARYLGTYDGLVVDNKDPAKRGRVKIKIPGLVEPSTNWALPVGGSHSSGEPGRGAFDPPRPGAAVIVQFLKGDPDAPVYFGGWRGLVGGKTDAPTEVQNASAADAANKLKVYESDAFEIIIDERGDHPQSLLRRKSDGTAIRLRDKGAPQPIQLGSTSASEAFILGTSYRRSENQRDQGDLIALTSMLAAAQGPLSGFQPGLNALIADLQSFQTQAQQNNDHLSPHVFGE